MSKQNWMLKASWQNAKSVEMFQAVMKLRHTTINYGGSRWRCSDSQLF